MAISGSESQSPSVKSVAQVEVECVKCDSCGFTEECTPAYISRVRQRYQGRWLCGLCVEAVKHEVVRSDSVITTEEALDRHISFCREFRSSTVLNKTEHPIFAMGRVLRRSLDSPRPLRSNSSVALPSVDGIPAPHLLRSESCFPTIPG
ncbi:palmitoyl-acyl carrier protein thioesterase [Spatholobus suberectus]|nr:palmitoyl-acyl carrier protein thioesterase [Spatholobus suberectus]